MKERPPGYDNDPPRCGTCVYRKHGHVVRTHEVKKPSGKVFKVQTKTKAMLDMCTWANMEVKIHHVCDEWHGRDGRRSNILPTATWR